MMKHFLGWSKIQYFTRKMTKLKPTREAIDNETIEFIRQHNQLDIELYELAVQIFEEQVLFLNKSVNIYKEFLENPKPPKPVTYMRAPISTRPSPSLTIPSPSLTILPS